MPIEPVYNVPPKSGILTSRTVKLGDTEASRGLVDADISARNTQAQVAQINQQKEAIKLKAANDAKIDGALTTAAQVNLESAGALRPGILFALPSAKGTMGPQLTTEYQLVNQEKNRSKQILTESFAEKDPISEELDKKLGQVEDELNAFTSRKQQGSAITSVGAEAGGGAGGFLQDFIAEKALGQDTSLNKEQELKNTIANLKQSQATINSFKSDLQLKKFTTDYLTELKGQGKKFGEQEAATLMQKAKEITANQRHLTRGDDLYDDNTYNTYIKDFQGKNDFFDWRHTDISLGNAINSVYNQVKSAQGPEREELVGVLNQLQGYSKRHEGSNKDAYDHYYGGSKQYYKENTPWKTYLGNQIGGGVGEGLYNALGTIVSTSQDLLGYHSAAFASRQGKDKYFSADMLQADLDGDGRITERDQDINGQYQYIGKNVTYIKAGDGPDKKGRGDIGFIGQSVLGASVRTLAEMAPTLLLTRGMMAAGAGMRIATFAPVALTSTIRSYEENRKFFKDKGTAALVSSVQGIIEGATESIVPDISYFMGNKSLGTKALNNSSRKYFTAQTLVPEFTTLSNAGKNFLLGTVYAGKALGKQTLQEGAEEELSMFANYILDKQLETKDDLYGKREQELDDSSVEGFFKSVAKTFVESAAAGLLMSGTAIGSSRTEDRNYMRFNIANNPDQFKAELKSQLEAKKITQDQYNKGILETGRLSQLQEQATSTMMNLVDSENLLEDHDKQYEYFSKLLTRDDLLTKVDYNALSETEKAEYVKKVETVEKEIDSFENSARQYANMPKEEKEGILAKMFQKNLETVKNTNNPAVLSENLEAITDAIEIGEKTGKGSQVVISGRQQVREALVGQIERLQTVEDNGNTVYENQLLNTPIESAGESMQISNAVKLENLLTQNKNLVSPAVRQQLLGKIAQASSVARERLNSLSKKEQKKVIARELARVELIYPGTAFNKERLKTLFGQDLTQEEHSEVIQQASVITAREKETLKDEDILQPQDEDITLNSLLKSIEAAPAEIQVENEMGNVETKRNEERVTRERRAVMSIPRAKSKEQARGRVKAIFKILGYDTEQINKALEDLNKVFDNQEVTSPGEIYEGFLRFLDSNLLRSLPDRAITTSEDVLAEEPIVTETVTTPTSTDAVADIEKRRQEELNREVYGYNYEVNYRPDVAAEYDTVLQDWIDTPSYAESRERNIEAKRKYLEINAKYDAELAALGQTSTTISEEDALFGTNEEIDARRGATEVVVQGPTIDAADEVITETPIPVVDPLDGLEVVAAKSIDSPNLVATIPTVFTNSNAVVQSSIMRTISQSLESFNLKLVDMFSFIRETLGESAMPTLEKIYNNVTEALKTNDTETIARLKEEYLAVFSGSTFANEQLEYIWKTQYVNGKPDASIPFQDLAYVTNGQFATAYQGDEVIVTAVKKETGEVFTYNATVTGKVNESNQIEVKTRNGNIVYIKKSNLQTIAPRTISVRANFNQTNSIMMTAVDRTTGEIAKFNSNGERDAQGDTQLNTFVPQANPTMIEVRKSLASGQPVAHTLPIHAGARINSAFAYEKGKTSVYLTASVTGINTDIQTVAPIVDVENIPIEQAPTAEIIKETEAKIKRKDLFDGVGEFSRILGNSGVDSVPVSHSENNGIELVQYANPKTGSVDVIVTGTSDNDFVGFYRIYEDGKPTNKWSSKFENQSRNKENFKTMMGSVQAILPEGHEYTEKASISTDGLRVWNQQLARGYELQYDESGKLKTNLVAINGDAIQNELGIPVEKGNFENIKVKTKEEYEIAKKALLPYMEKFGLNESNINWYTGTIKIDLPVLKKSSQPIDAKADIEKRRQEELIIPNTNVSLYDSVKKLEKGIEGITNKITELEKKGKGIIANQITGVTSLSGLATDRKRLKDIREKELQKIDKINAKYDAELAALGQPAFEPEVTTNLSKDELAILSFDTSQIDNLEISENSINQSDAKEIEDAASCKL